MTHALKVIIIQTACSPFRWRARPELRWLAFLSSGSRPSSSTKRHCPRCLVASAFLRGLFFSVAFTPSIGHLLLEPLLRFVVVALPLEGRVGPMGSLSGRIVLGRATRSRRANK